MVIEKDKCIDTILASRNLFLKLMDGLTIEQLNQVPEGFNNNIIWNFGHVIVSQQILCYKLAGLPMKIDASYVAKYSKGTKPETFLDEKELEFLKGQSIGLINELVADIEKNIFTSYNNYTTSFNVELNSVDDAVKFITMHEGLHLGYAMALKRIVNR
ncbi:DinB family protein [Ferruginibacter paludis]|uniref:DinB family protein n=1 Tax=Ferruginibacter paludis TaxID=1310417 RepID=UPI0025B511F3|nr:DinB family protein [Ferruginibacter paludis]MDN3654786.1 DinB family protein [Ferruginibacter paludis]